jgi:hypothetical protein
MSADPPSRSTPRRASTINAGTYHLVEIDRGTNCPFGYRFSGRQTGFGNGRAPYQDADIAPDAIIHGPGDGVVFFLIRNRPAESRCSSMNSGIRSCVRRDVLPGGLRPVFVSPPLAEGRTGTQLVFRPDTAHPPSDGALHFSIAKQNSLALGAEALDSGCHPSRSQQVATCEPMAWIYALSAGDAEEMCRENAARGRRCFLGSETELSNIAIAS